MTERRARGLACMAAVALLCTAASDAAAAPGAHAVTTELGAGSMLSSDQRDKLGYGAAVHGGLLAGVSLTEALMFQISIGSWWFPSSLGYGRDTMFGLGLRFEPKLPPLPKLGLVGRLVVDAHPAITRSAGLARFGFDAGLGYELALGPWLGVGPMLRYGQVRAAEVDGTDDAKFWSLGLAVTLRCEP